MSLTEDKGIQMSGQACKAHDYDLMKPVVLASWKHGFQGSWSDKSAVLAESQVNTLLLISFTENVRKSGFASRTSFCRIVFAAFRDITQRF